MWSDYSVIVLHYSVIGFHGIGCITRSNVYGGAGHNNPGGGGHSRGVIQLSVNPQVFTLLLQLKASSGHTCYAVKIVGTCWRQAVSHPWEIGWPHRHQGATVFHFLLNYTLLFGWLPWHEHFEEVDSCQLFPEVLQTQVQPFLPFASMNFGSSMRACRPSSASCHCSDQ